MIDFDFSGLINELISKLIDAIKNFILDFLNTPINPLVDLLRKLLLEPVNIQLFYRFWAIIVYVLSIFYGLVLLFAGFSFITSSYDAIKREHAKESLKNAILMIIFVSSSYVVYGLLVDMSSIINNGILSLVNNNLFFITFDNPLSFSLQVLLLFVYALVLLFTIILLGIRYLIVSLGLVLFPIGLFFNFITPLKSYGKLIINTVLTAIFLPIFLSLVILVSSKLLEIGMFSDIKIIVAIFTFSLINSIILFLALFVLIKSVLGALRSDLVRAVSIVAGKLS